MAEWGLLSAHRYLIDVEVRTRWMHCGFGLLTSVHQRLTRCHVKWCWNEWRQRTRNVFFVACCCGGAGKGSSCYHPSGPWIPALYSWAIDHTLCLSLDVSDSHQWTCILGSSWKRGRKKENNKRIWCGDVELSLVTSCNRLDWGLSFTITVNKHLQRRDSVPSSGILLGLATSFATFGDPLQI